MTNAPPFQGEQVVRLGEVLGSVAPLHHEQFILIAKGIPK